MPTRLCRRERVSAASSFLALAARSSGLNQSTFSSEPGPATLLECSSHRRTSMRSLGSLLLSFLAIGLLGGCGWQLQGTSRLSEAASITYIETNDRYSDFYRALRERLQASGARLTERREDARAIIRIRYDQSGQRVLAVSARNTPEEYEVFYAVEYSVSNQTEELIEPSRVELTREYSYDETAVLAKQKEQAVLREALARDLAGLLVRRLSTL